MSYDSAALKAMLTNDEGRKLTLYVDTMGNTSAGIGRNLTGVGFSDDEVDLMYANDIAKTEAFLDANVTWWRTLDPVRQLVLMNMAFNMRARLLGFIHALAAMQTGDWTTAHDEMLNSAWAGQVGARATRLARIMLTGVNV